MSLFSLPVCQLSHLTKFEISAYNELGTFFGALTAAPVGDLLGRRMGLMASVGIVFNLGVILQTISTSQPLFIAGRFFAGYGVGLVSALSKSSHPHVASSGRIFDNCSIATFLNLF